MCLVFNCSSNILDVIRQSLKIKNVVKGIKLQPYHQQFIHMSLKVFCKSKFSIICVEEKDCNVAN